MSSQPGHLGGLLLLLLITLVVMSGGEEPEPEEVMRRLVEALRVSNEQLKKALEDVEYLRDVQQSRYVIEQAKGMLMAQSAELTADDAFEILRKASQRENVKLRDIAQRIVDRRFVSEE